MPAAAAARSFERTASIRWPRIDRRTSDQQAEQRSRPRARRSRRPGSGACRPAPGRTRRAEVDAEHVRLRDGRAAESPPPQRRLTKPNCSIATAAASVTTARLTPRTRSAETADEQPEHGRDGAPISGPSGNAEAVRRSARCEMVKPATPASASCTTEIWPTKPVITTSERQITVAEQRVDQRLAEVEREHDQRDDADDAARSRRPRAGAPAGERPAAASRRARRGPAGSRRARTSRARSRGRRELRQRPEGDAAGSVGNQRLRRGSSRGAIWPTPIARPATQAIAEGREAREQSGRRAPARPGAAVSRSRA